MAAHGPGRGATHITTLYTGELTIHGITVRLGVGAGDGTIHTGPDGDGGPDGVTYHRGDGQEPFAPTVLQAIDAPDIRDPQQAPVHTAPDTEQELIVQEATAPAHIVPGQELIVQETTTARLALERAHTVPATRPVHPTATTLTAPADAAITVIPAPLTVETVLVIRAVPEEDILEAEAVAAEEAEADIDIFPPISTQTF